MSCRDRASARVLPIPEAVFSAHELLQRPRAEANDAMVPFDFDAPADLFPARTRVGHRPIGYRRFDSAAEAIRYAVEQMPREFLDGTIMEIDSERLDGARIRELYDSVEYPLKRKSAGASR
jgi:hypothetical protein